MFAQFIQYDEEGEMIKATIPKAFIDEATGEKMFKTEGPDGKA